MKKKMDSILVRKYKPKDHSDVNRIFRSANIALIKNALGIGRKSPRVLGYLIMLFSIGFLYSIMYGCIFVLILSSRMLSYRTMDEARKTTK